MRVRSIQGRGEGNGKEGWHGTTGPQGCKEPGAERRALATQGGARSGPGVGGPGGRDPLTQPRLRRPACRTRSRRGADPEATRPYHGRSLGRAHWCQHQPRTAGGFKPGRPGTPALRGPPSDCAAGWLFKVLWQRSRRSHASGADRRPRVGVRGCRQSSR